MLFFQRVALLGVTIATLFAGGTSRAAELKEIAAIEIPGGAAEGKAPTARYSPTGKLLACVGNDFGVYVFDAKTHRPIGKIEVPGNQGEEATKSIRFSPDGKLLACSSANKKIYLFDAATLKPVRVSATMSDIVYIFDFSFDGSKIVATLPSKRKLFVLDVASGKILHAKKIESEDWLLVALNPVADEVAVGATNPQLSIEIMNLTNGKTLQKNELGGITPSALGYSPDGKTLFANREETCYIINAADLSVRKEIEDRFSNYNFSPNSKAMVFTNYAIHVLDVPTLKRAPPIDYTSNVEGGVGNTVLSPDGNLLAISLYSFRDDSTNLVLFDLKGKSMIADLNKSHKLNPYSFDLSPDGSRLVTSSSGEAKVRIWDVSPWSKPVGAPASNDGFRTWTSADGKFQVIAALVDSTSSQVTLKRKDNGAIVMIPVTGLSIADQQFLKSAP